MHSLYYNYAPRSFRNTIRRSEEREQAYNLRNNNTVIVPRFRIEFFKRFPIFNLPNKWNLAGDLIYHNNPTTFSVALKMELFEKVSANI
jgi:hypothetical protein